MRRWNHDRRFDGIPKIKLQAFEPSSPESLQSQTSLRSKNRLPLNDLGGSSRSTDYARMLFSLHTRLRVHWAPGIPCALCFLCAKVLANLGRIAPRDRGCASVPGCLKIESGYGCADSRMPS